MYRASGPAGRESTGRDLGPRRRGPGPRARRRRPWLEPLESRRLLSTIHVRNTNDSGPGSLRGAIDQANVDATADDIVFDIPASTAPLLNVPVSGFNPVTQDWTITLQTPLPPIKNPVWI